MSAATAWQMHGCYRLGSSQYYDFPVDAALNGCHDDSVSLDHRDPTHPVRNIIKSMYALRANYPVLNDGFGLLPLSNQTHYIFLPGSNNTPTETGMWSTVRTQLDEIQNLQGETPIWLVYQNEDRQRNYQYDCSKVATALFAPFPGGTSVKNLLAPYEELILEDGPGKKFFVDKSTKSNGCLKSMTLDQYGFKAFVPTDLWVAPEAMLTDFIPGYDARLKSAPTLEVELHFSDSMDCDAVTRAISIKSTTEGSAVPPRINTASVKCGNIPKSDAPAYGAYITSAWRWTATLTGVSDGIHMLTLDNPSGANNSTSKTATNSVDHLMFRVGQPDNIMVFPRTANYSRTAYSKGAGTGNFEVTHSAAGADNWRYSTNWGSSWSSWRTYNGGKSTVTELPWSGTNAQQWSGDHITLQYWSKLAGSSDAIQHADANWGNKPPRSIPHIFAQGDFNQFGFDAGLPAKFKQSSDGTSSFHLSTEWRVNTSIQLNVWGMDPDGQPDQGWVYGDADNDTVLDRSLPGALSQTTLNFTKLPPSPYIAFRVQLDESTLRYTFVPEGSRLIQIIVFALLWVLPLLASILGIWIYMGAYYKIKLNRVGLSKKRLQGVMGIFSFGKKSKGFERLDDQDEMDNRGNGLRSLKLATLHSRNPSSSSLLPVVGGEKGMKKRRCVLIATMEYDIEDWVSVVLAPNPKQRPLGILTPLSRPSKSRSEVSESWHS